MNSFSNILNGIINKNNSVEGDYTRDGLLYCGKCNTPKQAFVPFPVEKRLLPIPCECKREEIEAEEARENQRRRENLLEALRRDGITDTAYLNCTFKNDDRKNVKISNMCLKYVDEWEEMRANNIGILFYGEVGTGKSFYSCAIANALIDRLIPVCVSNFPRILNQLQFSVNDRQKIIDDLQRYHLLIIDDLGVERDSPYAMEQVYNIVDSRARAGLPLIITTNLGIEKIENPENLQYKRIYDRILEMCPIRIKMIGESRRTGIAKKRESIARKILLGGKNE